MIVIEILLMLPWFAVCIGLIALALYMRKKDQEFKTKGIKTIFKVKDVLVNEIHYENGKIAKQFTTTFEYIINGQIKEISIPTKEDYDLEEEIEGYYLPDAKHDQICAPGIGFYKAKGAEWILIAFAIAMIVMVVLPIFFE